MSNRLIHRDSPKASKDFHGTPANATRRILEAGNPDVSLGVVSADYLIKLHAKQGGKCAITGRNLILNSGDSNHLDNLSIDKKNRNKGYTKGNIRLVTMQANTARYIGNDTQLKNFCRDVLRTLK